MTLSMTRPSETGFMGEGVQLFWVIAGVNSANRFCIGLSTAALSH